MNTGYGADIRRIRNDTICYHSVSAISCFVLCARYLGPLVWYLFKSFPEPPEAGEPGVLPP